MMYYGVKVSVRGGGEVGWVVHWRHGLCCVVLCWAVSCCEVLWHNVLCHAGFCLRAVKGSICTQETCVVQSYVGLWSVVLWHVFCCEEGWGWGWCLHWRLVLCCVVSCCVVLCYVVECYLVKRREGRREAIFTLETWVVLCCTMLCCLMLWSAVLWHDVLCCAGFCLRTVKYRCCTHLSCAVLYYAVLSNAVKCYVVTWCVMLCRFLFEDGELQMLYTRDWSCAVLYYAVLSNVKCYVVTWCVKLWREGRGEGGNVHIGDFGCAVLCCVVLFSILKCYVVTWCVMLCRFLFEGGEGRVLYTGDFRWEKNYATSLPALCSNGQWGASVHVSLCTCLTLYMSHSVHVSLCTCTSLTLFPHMGQSVKLGFILWRGENKFFKTNFWLLPEHFGYTLVAISGLCKCHVLTSGRNVPLSGTTVTMRQSSVVDYWWKNWHCLAYLITCHRGGRGGSGISFTFALSKKS